MFYNAIKTTTRRIDERKLPYLSKNIFSHSLQIKLVSVASRRRRQQIGQSLSFSVEAETVKGILLSLAESIQCCIKPARSMLIFTKPASLNASTCQLSVNYHSVIRPLIYLSELKIPDTTDT